MSEAVAQAIRRWPALAGVASATLATLLSACIGGPAASAKPAKLSPFRQSEAPELGRTLSALPEPLGGLLGLTIMITAPKDGATYGQGQVVTAAYTCSTLPKRTLIECAGTVANGAAIETSTLGVHTFTVNAMYSGGSHDTHDSRTVKYTVAATGAPQGTGSPSRTEPILGSVAAPILGSVSETATTWREGGAVARVRAKRAHRKALPLGTTFSFSLNEPASVTFAFTTHAIGRKVGTRCAAQTPKNRRRSRCTRTVTAGSLIFGAHAGTNRVRFEGVVSKRSKLAPGSYTLLVTATASGRRSQTRTAHFTIARL